MRALVFSCLLLIALAPFSAFAQTSTESAPYPQARINRDALSFKTEPVLDEAGGIEQDAALEALASALASGATSPSNSAHGGGPPQPVTLSARISDTGSIIPNGAVWRIFDTKTDSSGQLALLAKSEDSVAAFNLSPGNYVVHVAYGRSQSTETLQVVEGLNAKTLVLEAGALQLSSAITGDTPISDTKLRFEVYTTGESEQDRALIVNDAMPGEIIHLNAGVYHIVSHFGSVNAEVRADLRVEPGQLTEATLYHRASEVGFKLVSEEGGEAIADVDWTIKNAEGETLFTDFGGFPSTILAEGEYTVLAKRGANIYNRPFQIQAGPRREIELLTSI